MKNDQKYKTPSKHETIADIVAAMLEFADTDSQSIGRDVLRRRIQHFARRFEAAHKRDVTELEAKLYNIETAGKFFAIRLNSARKQIAELRECLKVAEDALRKLQERFVSSVYDGTIDPHEALKIAEDAIATIREEGGAK